MFPCRASASTARVTGAHVLLPTARYSRDTMGTRMLASDTHAFYQEALMVKLKSARFEKFTRVHCRPARDRSAATEQS